MTSKIYVVFANFLEEELEGDEGVLQDTSMANVPEL